MSYYKLTYRSESSPLKVVYNTMEINKKGCVGLYRYGFNGMENDNEVKGTGNHIDFGARGYDPRVGKFLSIDPKTNEFSDQSPYSFAANNPIYLIDKEGESPFPSTRHLGNVFNAFHNALKQSAHSEGYSFYRTDNQEGSGGRKNYGSKKVTGFKYYDSKFHRTLGANEYRGDVQIKLTNGETIKANI